MTADELRAMAALPDGLSLALQALWYEAQGDWTQAHDLLQDDDSADGYTPIFIASRATPATPRIGIGASGGP